jgi:NADP-dependent 3-hydroxy acid dehydrogenase YdfG
MKTIAIVGAGPGLGLSIARKFGKNGFQVALIARNLNKLNQLVEELVGEGIEASAFEADILNREHISAAIAAVRSKYGDIDVVEYSPTPGIESLASTLEVTEENVLYQFQFNVLGAVSVVREVLPDMLKKKEGALLFTTGGSAIYPFPMMTNVGIAMAGLRNYIMNLHSELKDKGIFAGHISIGVWMQQGSGVQDKIADMWYDMYVKRDRVEEFVGEGRL